MGNSFIVKQLIDQCGGKQFYGKTVNRSMWSTGLSFNL